MKTAVVTDSTAYIPKEIREHLHIHMIPLQVIFGRRVYEEEVDIDGGGVLRKSEASREIADYFTAANREVC